MSANVEGMVREGVNAFKAGRKDEARALLSKAVELDPYNEEGWLWLSGVVTSVDDQRTCLENVLAINPGNSRARSGLDFLIRQNPSAAPPPAPVPPASAPPSPAAAVVAPVADAPTSVEWADDYTEEPDDDRGWPSAEPAPTDSYDEWVTGLQLGAPQGAPVARSDPFASASTSSSPFFDDDDLADLTTGESLFADDDAFGAVTPSTDVVASTVAAPASNTIQFRPPPADGDADIPLSVAAPTIVVAASAVPTPAPMSAAGLAEMEVDEEEILLTEEEISLFPDIPKEIKPTRLPGTHERGPLLLKLAVFALAGLNLAAAILFFWKVL